MSKYYLFDIEGTTTDIHFVHQILFPYSSKKLESFILENQNDNQVINALTMVQETLHNEQNLISLSVNQLIEHLLIWIKTDRKHMGLKIIQGLIWHHGYVSGEFKGHLYPDVLPFWKKIINLNSKIGIYSSGSVEAQKDLFEYSCEGNLSSYIDSYFDTHVGHKRDAQSYQKISDILKTDPKNIVFFSDIVEELIASSQVGISGIQLIRNEQTKSDFKSLTSFDQFCF